jgi:hypothetical protein
MIEPLVDYDYDAQSLEIKMDTLNLQISRIVHEERVKEAQMWRQARSVSAGDNPFRRGLTWLRRQRSSQAPNVTTELATSAK